MGSNNRGYLIPEPDQVRLIVLIEHAVLRVEQLLYQQHEELLLNTTIIHTLLPIEDHLHTGTMDYETHTPHREGGRGGGREEGEGELPVMASCSLEGRRQEWR